jgi:hypothetical protein
MDVAQGSVKSNQIVPAVGRAFAFIYTYNLIQCPLEAIHGRKSAVHNAIAGGSLGYIAVARGLAGIPFINATHFYRYPQLSPALIGGGMYGSIAGCLGLLSKPL